MNITILGSGVFGIALGHSFFIGGHHVTVWSKFEKEVLSLKDKYLDFRFTSSMKDALQDSQVIVMAVPIEFVNDTFICMKEYYQDQVILIASKGIASSSSLFAYQMLESVIPNASYGVISGGTFAKDMMMDMIMGLTLATKSNLVKKIALDCFNNHPFLKLDTTDDIRGVSLCGAVKNVMSIGLGILAGMEYSDSSKFLFLTHVIREIKDLIIYFDGDENTIFKYAGIDDIMMTCTSFESRNYTFGTMIGKNVSDDVLEEYKSHTTIEGFVTTDAIYRLLDDDIKKFPIIYTIYKILYKGQDSDSLIKNV